MHHNYFYYSTSTALWYKLTHTCIKSRSIKCKSVILAGDKAPLCLYMSTRLVMSPVTVLQFEQLAPQTETHQLGTHADTERGQHCVV